MNCVSSERVTNILEKSVLSWNDKNGAQTIFDKFSIFKGILV